MASKIPPVPIASTHYHLTMETMLGAMASDCSNRSDFDDIFNENTAVNIADIMHAQGTGECEAYAVYQNATPINETKALTPETWRFSCIGAYPTNR